VASVAVEEDAEVPSVENVVAAPRKPDYSVSADYPQS
jgi:hypothetical protein